MKNILIGSDIALIGDFADFQIERSIDTGLKDLIGSSSFNIYDLELPLTDSENAIRKTGPNLKMNPRMIDVIKTLKPGLLVTANNHIVDYGLKGLNDTEKILIDNNVPYIGSGTDAIEAFFHLN